jgi:cell division protein FtsQ
MFVALVLVAAAVVLSHSPWLSARVVTVTGVHPDTSEAAIVDAAGLQHHPPLVSVDPAPTAQKVEALPFIATAQVHRHWPDGVAIAVTERVPVATMAGPGGSWSVLDADGRTLAVQATRPAGLVVLAVRTGASVAPPAPVGGTLGVEASYALTVCRTLPPAFSAQVTSVTGAPDGTVSMALDSGITVLLGADDDLHAKYEDVAAIIAHGSLQGATTIDVTVPQSPAVTG